MTEAPHRTVLIIDDDQTFRRIWRHVGEQLSLRVVEAAAPEQAWELVQRQPPDVIVLDVLFPEGSALEFLRQLRQEERLRNCPVLVCSAVAEREAVLQLAREGIQGWLIKPFSISEAQQRLLRLLGAHQSDSAQQMQPTPQP